MQAEFPLSLKAQCPPFSDIIDWHDDTNALWQIRNIPYDYVIFAIYLEKILYVMTELLFLRRFCVRIAIFFACDFITEMV